MARLSDLALGGKLKYSAHRLATADLKALASGRVTSASVQRLAEIQRSKNTLLLEAIRRDCHPHSPPQLSLVERAMQLLVNIQDRHPATIARLLITPHFGFWAADCLFKLKNSRSGHIDHSDANHLASFAAVAGLLSKQNFELTIPVYKGVVVLPTLGQWYLGRGTDPSQAQIALDQNGVTLNAGSDTIRVPLDVLVADRGNIRGWVPTPKLVALSRGIPILLMLEKHDPFLSRLNLISSNIDEEITEKWQRLFTDAWNVLCRTNTYSAAAIAEGLSTVIPLINPRLEGTRSASSGWAWGLVALSLPADPSSFAEAIIHEFHHLVLSAIEDVEALIRMTGDPEFGYAPWRDDPRPIPNLLQGCYAFLGVCEFWHRQCSARTATTKRRAEINFSLRRLQVSEALHQIVSSGILTDAGASFTGAMRNRVDAWTAHQLSAECDSAASEIELEHLLRWRLTNLHADAEDVLEVASAWSAKAATCPIKVRSALRVVANRPGITSRSHLLERSYWSSRANQGTIDDVSLSTGDTALLGGDAVGAADAYLGDVNETGSSEAWIGLMLALCRLDLVDRDKVQGIEIVVAVASHVFPPIMHLDEIAVLTEWLSTAPTAREIWSDSIGD